MPTTEQQSSPAYVSEETEIVPFYNELSSLVRSIPKHNVLLIGGYMNARIGKNGNNKYSLHNTSTCLNTNFQKREGNYGPKPTLTIIKHR